MLQEYSVIKCHERIFAQFLEAEIIPPLAWSTRPPHMSTTEHVWDPVGQQAHQNVSVLVNIHQLSIAQATINNQSDSLRGRYVTVHRDNGATTPWYMCCLICIFICHNCHNCHDKEYMLMNKDLNKFAKKI